MKFAVLATALATASTVSASAAPASDEFASRSPSTRVFNVQPGCQPWMWWSCGHAKRDGASIGPAEYINETVKAVQHSKDLVLKGSEATDITGDGYTHHAFLYDFYGGYGKGPEGAKHNETSTPHCVNLGLCEVV